MNTNFENYKTFYFVAKYGNITAAAEALYSEQPNVTRAIKNLERDLGCVLFTRSNKGVTLTPEGEKLYRRVSIAYEQIAAAEEELSRYNGFEEGILRIGVSETALHEVLLSALCKFHSLYPRIIELTSNVFYHFLAILSIRFIVQNSTKQTKTIIKVCSLFF